MPSKFDIHFFKTSNGREPVQEYIKRNLLQNSKEATHYGNSRIIKLRKPRTYWLII